ncbi:MAG: PKD domain-containing protein [Crocinitomicaceae bacterium]
MAHKLTDITTTFHSFAKSQVLTHTQLNEFLHYFDEQDRLSRVCLSGVGIVCGFDLKVNQAKSTVTITQGAGVTTDGDLIHLVEDTLDEEGNVTGKVLAESIEYTHYRTYIGESSNYHPHFNKDTSLDKFSIIHLDELLPASEAGPKDNKLDNKFLDDKVVLFYLESYSTEPDSCLQIDCNNQGIEEVSKLRALIVDVKTAEHIIKSDSLFNSYAATRSLLESNPVHVPRVILNEKNTSSINQLAGLYQNGKAFGDCVKNLAKGVGTIYSTLGRREDLKLFQQTLDAVFDWNRTRLFSFQYRYDLLKDLVDSYNELLDVFLENYSSCCPDITAFPKHLLLGKITIDSLEKKAAIIDVIPDGGLSDSVENDYRHKFHRSPILLGAEGDNERFEFVLNRIIDQVSSIYSEVINSHVKETVTITPSSVRTPLGKRAIPFYYRYAPELIKNWDFDRKKYGRYNSILGYRLAEKYTDNDDYPVVQEPLKFSIDPYNFYRIEGHQGLPYDDAFKQLKDLKEDYSLPFDIKVLGIGVDEFDEILEDQYKCDFKDLDVLLRAWSDEQVCIAKEATSALSGFSTENLGENIKVNDFFGISDATNLPETEETPSTEEGPSKGESPQIDLDVKKSNSKLLELAKNFGDAKALDDSKLTFETHIAKISDANLADLAAGKLDDYLNASEEEESQKIEKDLLKLIDDSIQDPADILAAKTDFDGLVKTKVDRDLRVLAIKELDDLYKESEELDRVKDEEIKTASAEANTISAHAILNTISVVPNTLGYIINNAIASTDGVYANVLAEANKGIKDRVPTNVDRFLYEGTIGLPNEIIIAIMGIVNQTPKSVTQLTNAQIKKYEDKIEVLCEYIKQMQRMYERIQEVENANLESNVRIMISLVLDQLMNICCSSVKLKSLLEEVENRKEQILNRLDFSKFVANNPGLEHKAGVEPGHTFVMVYLNKLKTWSNDSNTRLNGKEVEGSNENKGVVEENEKRLNINYIEKGTIIADFTLPYLCCSDCAPINFVLPDIPVSLVISSGTYCIDDNGLELDLKVTPIDGVVSVVDEIPGVIIKDKKLRIDESIFPPEKLGTVLRFRVNEKDTEAELLVSKKPEVTFDFPDPGSNRIVKFTVKGDDSDAYSYHWDFGNGRKSFEKNPIHDFTELVSSEFPQRFKYDITLTVTSVGGICPTVVSDSITFEKVEVSITDTACINGGLVPFDITPDGSFANIEGPGLNANKTHFDPIKTGVGLHKFTFEGKEMYVTVNDVVKINSKIEGKRKDDIWVFYAKVENETSYSWTAKIPGVSKSITSDQETLEIPVKALEKLEAGKDVVVIGLTVKGCGEDTADLDWLIPGGEEPNAWLEGINFCRSKKGSFEIQTENFTDSTKLTGVGVNNEVKPPTFTPFGLDLGETHILVDGEITDTVYIVDEPVAKISQFSYDDKQLTAAADVVNKSDVATMTWTFVDQDKKELHAPIIGKSAITVDFEKFSNTQWTEVTVVLTIDGGPCESGVDKRTIDKPSRVTFSLEETVFCNTDSKTYPILFDPEQGDVKVDGAGVNKEKNEFSPWKLAAKDYTLSATNGETFDITVVDKPSIGIGKIDRSENGFSTSATLPEGTPDKSITWLFEGVEEGSKELLHPTISGKRNIAVNFSDFFTKNWTQVKITLIAITEPCGEARTSTVFTKEEPAEVEVGLSKDVFCQNDKGTYGFIYTPDKPMVMTGLGVTASGHAFSPNGLSLGDHTFTATNGKEVSIEVIESSKLNIPVLNVKTETITFSYSPNDEAGKISGVRWEIGKDKVGGLPDSNDDTYVLSTEEHKLLPGDLLVYELHIKSEVCGDRVLKGSFQIPGVGGAETCEGIMLQSLTDISNTALTEAEINELKKKHPNISGVTVLYTLLGSMIKSPQAVISGSMNDTIVKDVESMVQLIEDEIQLAHERNDQESIGILTRLYRMAVGIYGSAFRCQTKVSFDNFSDGQKLNVTLRNHFDESKSESMLGKAIVVFDSATKAPFDALLLDTGVSEEPWSTIEFIINATPQIR